MPIEQKVYKCDFTEYNCGFIANTLEAAERHENTCIENPKFTRCKRCEGFSPNKGWAGMGWKYHPRCITYGTESPDGADCEGFKLKKRFRINAENTK